MSDRKLVEDVKELINEMIIDAKYARQDYRNNDANIIDRHADKLQFILSSNLSTAEFFELDE